MRRRTGVVYECPDCRCRTHAVEMLRLGGKVREPFRARDGVDVPAVKVVKVLCWWCRTYHSPEGVEACMVLPRKAADAGTSGTSTSNALDAGQWKQYSELWAFLTSATHPDGEKRRTGRISLSCESGMLGLSLNCEETGQYVFLNGRSLDDLLTEAEIRLSEGSLHWRPSRYQQKPAKK